MTRIEEERRVVERMIRLYCRHKEGNKLLCRECEALVAYAGLRLEQCMSGENKPTCRCCKVHCYRPDMRERIRLVMRWAGPRMILYAPFAAMRHLIREYGRQV